jgi:hypothetical protein
MPRFSGLPSQEASPASPQLSAVGLSRGRPEGEWVCVETEGTAQETALGLVETRVHDVMVNRCAG